MQLGLLILLSSVCYEAASTFDESSKLYPVTRVVELLKDMSKQLTAEQEQDEEIYEKLACWCETNDKAKTKSIVDAEARISDLGAKIESLGASSEQLNAEMASLAKEIERNEKALDVATAIREKQLAEFNAEEKEMLLSIQALGQAVVVLSKHHGGKASALAMKLVIEQMHKHKALLQGVITPTQRHVIGSFVQEPAEDFSSAKPTFKQAYKPQSGQIFGILNQMKETFEADLTDSQREEKENQVAFNELKAAKEKEIAAGKESLADKTQQLAATDEKNAQAKQDLDDTTNALGADQKFLMELKKHCAMTDQEWEARQKTRQEEIAAVGQAIAILSADDSRDTFSRTFNPAALFQRQAVSRSKLRHQAAELLAAMAAKTSDIKLLKLATDVRLDSFTRVKKAIDDMVAELSTEKSDEIKHKDFCVNNLHENKVESERTRREEALKRKSQEGLRITRKGLSDAIATLEAEKEDLRVQLNRATEDRAMEHKDFQGVVADQRETQQILQKALTVLKNFYDEQAASFAQNGHAKQTKKQAPPPGFDDYEKQGSTGVVMLLEQIIADAKALEAETVHDEEQAEKAQKKFKVESEASIEEKKRSIVNKEADLAKVEQDFLQGGIDNEAIQATLDGLAADGVALHGSCDFVLKNFEARQQARDEEVEALRDAKAILSGMKVE